MMKRIKEALQTPELQKDFEYLMCKLMCAEEDADVNRAMLSGEWPGWEWIKEAKTERGLK